MAFNNILSTLFNATIVDDDGAVVRFANPTMPQEADVRVILIGFVVLLAFWSVVVVHCCACVIMRRSATLLCLTGFSFVVSAWICHGFITLGAMLAMTLLPPILVFL